MTKEGKNEYVGVVLVVIACDMVGVAHKNTSSVLTTARGFATLPLLKVKAVSLETSSVYQISRFLVAKISVHACMHVYTDACLYACKDACQHACLSMCFIIFQ